MAGPYYTNAKNDGVDYIEASDLEAVETGFSDIDDDKANKKIPGVTNDFASLNALGDLADSGKTPPTGEVVGDTDTQTLSNKTLTNPEFDAGFTEGVYTITDSASIDIDVTNGTVQNWSLGGNRTPTATMSSGQSVLLRIADGAGYAITWSAIGVVWIEASAPNLATTGYTMVQLFKIESTVYGYIVGDVAT